MSEARSERWQRALDRDYFPSLDRATRRVRHPLAALGVAAVASFLVGLGIAPQGFVACGALSAVMVVGALWPWIVMRGVQATLRFPSVRAREGESVVVELTVRNRWPLPLWGVAVERGFRRARERSRDEAADVALSLTRIAPWSRQTYRWTFTPSVRGEYPTSTPRLTTSFPFGVWQAEAAISVEGSLLVWPRWAELESTNGNRRTAFAWGAPDDRTPGDEGETIGVREYRRGDGLRHVHWRQSARHGRLIVRERQRSVSSALRIVVDATPEHHGSLQDEDSLEWALRIAASLAQLAWRRGEAAELTLGSDVYRTMRGPDGLPPLLDALARFVPAPAGRGRRVERARTVPGTDEWCITTLRGWQACRERGSSPGLRWIVLDVDGQASRASSIASFGDAVFVAGSSRSVLEQFRRAWEGSRHDHGKIA